MFLVRAVASDRYEWITTDGGGAGASRIGALAELAAAAQDSSVFVVLAGAEARIAATKIPGKAERLVQQAAPFAVEDDLADEIEASHILCGPELANGERPVAIVGRATLHQLLEPLKGAALRLSGLAPDYLLLPWRAGMWTLLQSDAQVLVRTGRYEGFAIERDLLPAVLSKRLSLRRPTGFITYGEVALPLEARDLPCETQPLPASALAWMARDSTLSEGLNLLPLAYQNRQVPQRRSLQIAAGLLVLAWVLDLGLTMMENARLTRSIRAQEHAQQVLFQQNFPEITRLINPEVQAEQTVAKLRANASQQISMLALLRELGSVLQSDVGKGAALTSINFASGVMTVQITAADIAALERLSVALGATLKVEVVSVDSSTGSVHGSVRLEPLLGKRT